MCTILKNTALDSTHTASFQQNFRFSLLIKFSCMTILTDKNGFDDVLGLIPKPNIQESGSKGYATDSTLHTCTVRSRVAGPVCNVSINFRQRLPSLLTKIMFSATIDPTDLIVAKVQVW